MASKAVLAAASKAMTSADEMMRNLLDDGKEKRVTESLTDRTSNTGSGSEGGLLSNLGPLGPPLSFSPGESHEVVDQVKSERKPNASQRERSAPEVRRVEVRETQQSGNPMTGEEGSRMVNPQVRESGVERVSGEIREG